MQPVDTCGLPNVSFNDHVLLGLRLQPRFTRRLQIQGLPKPNAVVGVDSHAVDGGRASLPTLRNLIEHADAYKLTADPLRTPMSRRSTVACVKMNMSPRDSDRVGIAKLSVTIRHYRTFEGSR